MAKYRPLKTGTRVERASDGKKGVVRNVHPSGLVLVRFRDGSEQHVYLSLLRRLIRPKPPGSGRRKQVPVDPQSVNFESNFRTVVAERMKALSFTFEELAARSKLSRVTLYRLQVGEYRSFRVSTLEAIASALGISPRDFWSPAVEVPDVRSPPTEATP